MWETNNSYGQEVKDAEQYGLDHYKNSENNAAEAAVLATERIETTDADIKAAEGLRVIAETEREERADADHTIATEDHSAVAPTIAEVQMARGVEASLGDRLDASDVLTSKMSMQVNPIIYNVTVGLRRWRAELAKLQSSETGIININVLNNSIGEGSEAGTSEKGYVGLLKAKLASMFEDVGFGVIAWHLNSYFPTKRFTFTGAWIVGEGYGFNNRINYTISGGATASVTFDGTAVDILCVKSSVMGKINVSIDGGAQVEYTAYGTPEVACHAINISGLSNGTHTLVITKVADTKYFYLIGICPQKGTKGVRVNLVGENGTNTKPIRVNTKTLYASLGYWSPKLTVIELFANDLVYRTPEEYRQYMQEIITEALKTGDVLLFPTGIRENLFSYPPESYVEVLYDLAELNNVALIDCFNYWGGFYSVANSMGLLNDEVHPNAAGHQDLFNLLSKHIL